ncbi:MAG: hypothetical protein JRN06_03145 [Nitrososphaerota archaeon]|nr:hypothetical protein [Nitrososphaerota archaeon]MDG7023146.1 hypothetical protein [Nitrososphaerota archaeon]
MNVTSISQVRARVVSLYHSPRKVRVPVIPFGKLARSHLSVTPADLSGWRHMG